MSLCVYRRQNIFVCIGLLLLLLAHKRYLLRWPNNIALQMEEFELV